VTSSISSSYDPSLNNLTFEDFVQEYALDDEGSTFSSLAMDPSDENYVPFEVEKRRTIYNGNMEFVREQNKRFEAGLETWWAGPNNMTHLTDLEVRGFMGASKSVMRASSSSNNANKRNNVLSSASLNKQLARRDATLTVSEPEMVDWTSAVDYFLPNQQSCGSCFAHAAMGTIIGRLNVATGEKHPYGSRQMAVSCSKNPRQCGGYGGCSGSIVQEVYSYFMNIGGVPLEADYPYTSGSGRKGRCFENQVRNKFKYRVVNFTEVEPNNANAFYEALKNGPVAVNIDSTPWRHYSGGVLSGNACNKVDIAHVVIAVGMVYFENLDVYAVKIQNSWGRRWGEGGYIYLKMANPFNGEQEICNIDTIPASGTQCQADSPSTWKTLACGCNGLLYEPVYDHSVLIEQ